MMAQAAAKSQQVIAASEGGARTTASRLRGQLGFWSGLLTAVCALGFLTGSLAYPTPAWRGMGAYIASFDSSQMLWMIPALVLAPSFLVLMVCVHAGATDERKLLAEIAVVFATVYATLATTNYFIQLIAVRPSILSGSAQGLAFLSMANPNGLFIALEGLGYLFQEIGMLFVAFVFVGSRLKWSIRWSLFGASFGCWLIAGILVLALPRSLLSGLGSLGVVSVGTDLWAIFTALAGILLAVHFRKQGMARQGT